MVTTVLQPHAVVLARCVAVGVRVRVRDGEILEIGDLAPGRDPVEPIDGTLLPGLVDLQCNGAAGHGVDEAEPQALDAIAQAVWEGGAVAFLPTLVTAPFDVLLDRLAAVARWIARGEPRGAVPLGIHLEGPFLQTPGAHDAACFVDATPRRIDALLRAAGGHLALVTLAPGRRGAAAATARLRAAGVQVALGHGPAAPELPACIDAGARLVTHLFNAMDPLHHRAPGLAGHALDDPRLTCTLIPDGVHVHEIMLRNAYRCLGPERTALVTDSVAAARMPEGEYTLSGTRVWHRGGAVRDAAGHLAGSTLTMSDGARAFARMVPGSGLWTLSRVAAATPARALGCTTLGAIAPGRRALFCIARRDGQLHSSRPTA